MSAGSVVPDHCRDPREIPLSAWRTAALGMTPVAGIRRLEHGCAGDDNSCQVRPPELEGTRRWVVIAYDFSG